MPRPPADDEDEEFSYSITEMQRRARARRGREGKAFGDAREPTARVPRLGSPRALDAADAVEARMRRAGGAAVSFWTRLGRQRVWTLAVAALVVGGVVGGIFAVTMRRAAAPAAPPEAARPSRAEPAPGDPAVAPAPRAPSAAAAVPAAPRRPTDIEAARPAPAPRPVPVLGARIPATLYIVSEPFGAEIAVNGQSTGLKTPESVDGLAPGRTYKVTLTRKGYQVWEEDVEVAGGGPKHVSARLIPGGRKRK